MFHSKHPFNKALVHSDSRVCKKNTNQKRSQEFLVQFLLLKGKYNFSVAEGLDTLGCQVSKNKIEIKKWSHKTVVRFLSVKAQYKFSEEV